MFQYCSISFYIYHICSYVSMYFHISHNIYIYIYIHTHSLTQQREFLKRKPYKKKPVTSDRKGGIQNPLNPCGDTALKTSKLVAPFGSPSSPQVCIGWNSSDEKTWCSSDSASHGSGADQQPARSQQPISEAPRRRDRTSITHRCQEGYETSPKT